MNLDNTVLSEISQKELPKTIQCHLYAESQKVVNTQNQRVVPWLPGVGGRKWKDAGLRVQTFSFKT